MSTFLSSLTLYIFSMTHHKIATAFKGVLHRLLLSVLRFTGLI